MENEGLTEDPLFIACTRPAMWQGVPIQAMGFNSIVSTVFFVIMGNPLYMGIGVVVHYTIRHLVSRDYNMFKTIMLWSETKARARNTDLWGGSSVSPLPLRPARKPREVRTHV